MRNQAMFEQYIRHILNGMMTIVKKLNSFTFVCAMCFTWRIVYAELDKTCTLDNRVVGNPGICGEKLSEILHFLCGARYNKRSIPDGFHPEMSISNNLADETGVPDNSVFLSKAQALSHLRRDVKRSARYHGSGYRGIVCECCHHRCSIKELSQYCADPRTSLTARRSTMGKRSIPDASAAYNAPPSSGGLAKAFIDLSRLWQENEQRAERSADSHISPGDSQMDFPDQSSLFSTSNQADFS